MKENLKEMMDFLDKGGPFFKKANSFFSFADQKRLQLYTFLESASKMSDYNNAPWENVNPQAKEMLQNMPLKEKVAIYLALNHDILNEAVEESNREWGNIENTVKKYLQEV